MLSKINKKNDDIFDSLSNEAKVLYNHITGKDLSDDGIIMSGFDKNKIMVKDKQNESRNVELLSSATKDAVYISMRLSILTKIHEAGRLILLDDPFITFDNNRTKEALSFIREYSSNKLGLNIHYYVIVSMPNTIPNYVLRDMRKDLEHYLPIFSKVDDKLYTNQFIHTSNVLTENSWNSYMKNILGIEVNFY